MLKYATLSTNPYSSHMRIVQLVGNNKKVLDVGCSAGHLSKVFKENGCEVVGIELDDESAKIARNYCIDVIKGDVETINLNYPDEYFDVIVFGDILEHLKNPQTVLIKLRRYLKKDGYIVCSIPNIAHITVRLMLLMGKWEYEDVGLLDRTHLRFFTKKTAIKLAENAGFKIEEVYPTPWIPFFRLRKLHPIFLKIEYTITKMLPTLFALQFVIKARKI
ncbi:class I SAM-dependent methyltransferase [Methanotorris igneus]|uniref:Methyltransferase type 11 n=1 Tax=Methanotorris igneus (strain DSM 5666 / JCM 11834 / Kol 5) TaxID=880724 RepID=F6BAX6_METIK|nr:class I SAM-dependent methyltransferase [Methanotorris igneus]AEF97063.1 Methyltransferase type 11 [Methanotorris igneus Kol 5]